MTTSVRLFQIGVLAILVIVSGFHSLNYGQQIPAVKVLEGHRAGIIAVAFSKDGTQLASASLDGTVRIWSTVTWKTTKVLNQGAEVYTVAFSPDGKTLVSGGFDKRVVFWDVKTGKMRRSIIMPEWINELAITRAGEVVVGVEDGIVRILDLKDGTIKHTINIENAVGALAVSGDERYLVTGSGEIKLWDFASGKFLKKVQGYGFYSFAFAPGGESIASADPVGGVKIFSVSDGKLFQSLRITAERKPRLPPEHLPISIAFPARSVNFSPAGNLLASGDANKNVLLWQVSQNKIGEKPFRTLAGHTMSVISVNFSPDGKLVASGSLDRTVRVWETQ